MPPQTGIVSQPFYLTVLLDSLRKKKSVNPRFSIRAFARMLGVNPGALTQILKGRRFFSAKLAQRMFSTLSLGEAEKTLFLQSLAEMKQKSGMQRIDRGLQAYLPVATEALPVTPEQFRDIADWYHYAILEMTLLEQFNPSPEWIARELSITLGQARTAVDRLERMGLLERVGGKLVRHFDRLEVKEGENRTKAHRSHQEQLLQKSTEALKNIPIELRNHSAMTLAIDPAKLPEAKLRLEKFLNELTDFLDTGRKTAVYGISLQMFPLQKIDFTPPDEEL